MDAQINYQHLGVAERKNLGRGRLALEGETLEVGWRPIDPSIDNLEQPTSGEDYSTSYPWSNTTVFYYWRSTYWRRVVG